MGRPFQVVGQPSKERLHIEIVHITDLGTGRLVLRRKGDYRELRLEVWVVADATGRHNWVPADQKQQHRILMSFAKRQLLEE